MKLIRPVNVTDSLLLASNIPENDYQPYDAALTYAQGVRVIVIAANVHKIYESLAAANTGNAPASSPTWWLEVGTTNRWRMFDTQSTPPSSQANSIDVTLQAQHRVDALALLNINAESARVLMTDSADGVIFDQTYSLTSNSGITDWYAYFFEPIRRKTDLVLTDLPRYSSQKVRVVLNAGGELATCGVMVIGQLLDIGGTQYGAKLGIADYSVKKRNDFGDYQLLERAYSRTASFQLEVPAGFVDEVIHSLAEYRAKPVVYVGSEQYGASAVFGFYKDFSVTIAYPSYSICSIDIEGLT